MPTYTSAELKAQIDAAVSPLGGPPKTTGPGLNAVLTNLAAGLGGPAGVLYAGLGAATDGALTQAATTQALADKLSLSEPGSQTVRSALVLENGGVDTLKFYDGDLEGTSFTRLGWRPTDGAVDVGLMRQAAGTIKVIGTGTEDYAHLEAADVTAHDAPADLNTLGKLAAASAAQRARLDALPASAVWQYVGDAAANNIVRGPLGANVALAAGCQHNTFGGGCSDLDLQPSASWNTIDQGCDHVSYGAGASFNVLGSYNDHVSYGAGANYNVIGQNGATFAFGNGCQSNVVGDRSWNVTFDHDCHVNKLGDYNRHNTFAAGAYGNRTGSVCTALTFGANASYNQLGCRIATCSFGAGSHHNQVLGPNNDLQFGDNCQANLIEPDCTYVQLGAGCTRVRVQDCHGTADAPFLIPAGTTDAFYRHNALVPAAAAGPAELALEFVFEAGYADEVTRTLGTRQAGTYATEQRQNVASASYYLNGSPTAAALPLTLAAADTLRVALARTDASRPAVLTLLS